MKKKVAVNQTPEGLKCIISIPNKETEHMAAEDIVQLIKGRTEEARQAMQDCLLPGHIETILRQRNAYDGCENE